MRLFAIGLFFTVWILQENLVFAEPRCRCLANNATCWPSATVWRTFNESVNGRLLLPKPSAAVCNGVSYNAAACAVAAAQWINSVWRSDQVGAMQNHNWENSSCSVYANTTTCNQGAVPVFAVDAILPEHVQTTVRFASGNRLRLVVKSTGHDYFGRSGATGSLLLWGHHMKNMTLIDQYSSCGMGFSTVSRLGAGAQWGEVYRWLNGFNLTAIGGASGTVAAVGGYLQGGGHGPLSRWKGMAADQVLEYDVVTANGERQTVSRCQNSDLYWALSGGGGGTYAVVLSAVLRTFPTPSMVTATFDVRTPSENRYSRLMSSFIRWLPSLADAGWSSYFTITDLTLSGVLHWPNGDLATATATLGAFAANNSDLNFSSTNIFVQPTFYSYYATILEQSNPTGFNVLLGSRLIPESVVRNEPDNVAQVFVQSKGRSQLGSSLLGHLVAGGQVSNSSRFNNSVNPGWRTALLHMVFAQAWRDTTSAADQNYLAQEVTRNTAILNQLSNGKSPSCYLNEADPSESNWRETFFGTMAIYNQLKSIKRSVDPDGLFVCKNCVGSDDWTSDLNCPKKSNVASINLKFSLLIVQVFVYFS